MRICTFNIKNNYRDYKKEKSIDIYNLLRKRNIDILGLQEVFIPCNNDLKRLLKDKYEMIGKYRFLSRIIKRTSNEKTPIITNYEILYSKTYHLPYFPSHLKRVMTQVVINYNGKLISIYNTHLEARIHDVKKRELDKIYEILKQDNNIKILLGDFNLKITNPDFIEFIKKIETLNLKRVPISEKTLKDGKDNNAIDHIFIDNSFKLIKKEVIKTLSISDHYPVMIEIGEI